jgi:hypothetical protein
MEKIKASNENIEKSAPVLAKTLSLNKKAV